MDKERLENIRKMETVLNEMTSAVEDMQRATDRWGELMPRYKELFRYYSEGDWMEDHDAASRGEIPEGMSHGVLTEDAVYDLYSDQHFLAIRLIKLALEILE